LTRHSTGIDGILTVECDPNNGGDITINAGFIEGDTTTTVSGADVTLLPGWNYYAVNFDRSGLMTLYVNGGIADTADISAAVLGTFGGANGLVFCRGGTDCVVARGPIAHHLNSLLTGGQMRDSMSRRGVQLLATTQGAWDWRGIAGHTAWAPDETGITWVPTSYYSYGPAAEIPIVMPWAIPLGASPFGSETISVPDISAGGRPLAIRAAATAATLANTAESFSMGADSFFR
jgi:hypothetical protein